MDNNKDINEDVIRDFLKKSKGEGFTTPDAYFEGFQKNVHSKIHTEKKAWWLLPQFKWAATGVACVAVSIVLLKDFTDGVGPGIANNAFSQDELIAYYSDNIDEISEEEILDLITDEDLASINQTITSDTTKTNQTKKTEKEEVPTLDDFTDEEIYEYMLDEGYGDGSWDEL